ncbi:QacE family quaternary ammonium compound efflux SMR transporter [Gordonia sp. TBRC 11910]|uniref:QacE family quaternary ammonium compound efflux SMR transporter n=1 Tax=Gordonia asplenii TaxID=2725283 RepID=A0A848KZG9_9ACTN|nr:SMR family transporter [Gordonia asplenii]NMO01803.1 QacE family quaternary ammonium compound efflux SMR transporter [Gordonia asplenii]
MAYLFLACAIASELIATLALRVAATGRPSFYAIVTLGYLGGFAGLLIALRQGIPLGVAYGVWTAAGVALTAVASRILFDEPLTRRMIGGIALIAAGVLLVELGAAH